MTPHEFVNKWREITTSTERQVYQQHFLDLCELVGHQKPADLDPDNNFFTFEAVQPSRAAATAGRTCGTAATSPSSTKSPTPASTRRTSNCCNTANEFQLGVFNPGAEQRSCRSTQMCCSETQRPCRSTQQSRPKRLIFCPARQQSRPATQNLLPFHTGWRPSTSIRRC